MAGGWTILVCGEPNRGDDGAALEVARLLVGLPPGTRVRTLGQVDAGDVVDASRDGPCLVLDAVRGLPPGTTVEAPLATLSAAVPTTSSHAMPLQSTVALATALGAELGDSRFVGIAGREFELGRPLSPEVRDGLAAAVQTVRSVVGCGGTDPCA